ncbi:MAG TPA: TIM barrel protein [Bacteroidota bacterium]|nr:TIM barrel protein [Bacteroidota bacterium]
MNLSIFRHLWGITEPWETLFPKIASLNFQGIEHILPDEQDKERFRRLLDLHGFKYIAQIVTNGSTVDDHLSSFRHNVERAAELHPLKINCHSGCDWFSPEQSKKYFGEALAFEAKIGIPVAHETHRGRILYNPWTTESLLKQYPELKLSCDLSHWVVISERLLDTEREIIALSAEHCIHIHARVGYEEGPQVPDPRAPEYRRHVEAHEEWWDAIWNAQERKGMKESTLTPEFGAPEYLHTLPYTRTPVADLWEICTWQADRQRTRFAAR